MDPTEKARHAQRILDDDVFKEALAEADEMFVRQWRGADKPEVREQAWYKLQALDEVLRVLRGISSRAPLNEYRKK